MQAVSGQLRHDGASFDRSIADDSDRTPYVDDGGRPPTGSRSSINDQIERVAKAVLNLFSRRGRRYTFTIRTGAGHRSESAQEITQRLPGTETDADRAQSLQSPHRRSPTAAGKTMVRGPGQKAVINTCAAGECFERTASTETRLRSARESVFPPTGL